MFATQTTPMTLVIECSGMADKILYSHTKLWCEWETDWSYHSLNICYICSKSFFTYPQKKIKPKTNQTCWRRISFISFQSNTLILTIHLTMVIFTAVDWFMGGESVITMGSPGPNSQQGWGASGWSAWQQLCKIVLFPRSGKKFYGIQKRAGHYKTLLEGFFCCRYDLDLATQWNFLTPSTPPLEVHRSTLPVQAYSRTLLKCLDRVDSRPLYATLHS